MENKKLEKQLNNIINSCAKTDKKHCLIPIDLLKSLAVTSMQEITKLEMEKQFIEKEKQKTQESLQNVVDIVNKLTPTTTPNFISITKQTTGLEDNAIHTFRDKSLSNSSTTGIPHSCMSCIHNTMYTFSSNVTRQCKNCYAFSKWEWNGVTYNKKEF